MLLEPFIILPLIFIIAIPIIVIFLIKNRKNFKTVSKNELESKVVQEALIKKLNKRLVKNPNDSIALTKLADIYYNDKDYGKSLKLYSILLNLSVANDSLDQYDITVKRAISALNEKDYKMAYNDLLVARSHKPLDCIVNYNLGYLEYIQNRYERSASFLLKAKSENPKDVNVYKYLGLSLIKLNRFSAAEKTLKFAIELDPNNSEALLALGECSYNLGKNTEALETFSQIKDDPEFGPKASLYAGTILMRYKKYNEAIVFFEKVLEKQEIAQDIWLDLNYKLATCYIQKEDFNKAVSSLEDIASINYNYKDVEPLLNKYGELNSNNNFKVFLLGKRDDFLELCKSIIAVLYPTKNIKINNVNIKHGEYTDIIATLTSKKSVDTVICRFFRSNGQVGELIARDLYEKIKENKANRGVCVSAGTFSDGARKFVEARIIELIDKRTLVKLLKKIA